MPREVPDRDTWPPSPEGPYPSRCRWNAQKCFAPVQAQSSPGCWPLNTFLKRSSLCSSTCSMPRMEPPAPAATPSSGLRSAPWARSAFQLSPYVVCLAISFCLQSQTKRKELFLSLDPSLPWTRCLIYFFHLKRGADVLIVFLLLLLLLLCLVLGIEPMAKRELCPLNYTPLPCTPLFRLL